MAPFSTLVFLAALASGVTAVDLHTCNIDVQARLDNGSLSSNDPIFFTYNGSHHMSQPGNIALTIEGCESTCPKPFFDLYSDMWPRLLTWLIPALLLVGSVHIPRVGRLNRFFVIVHFIGDPIDSMWSLMTKAEVWNRFYRIALRHTPPGPQREHMARALAAMLSAFEELTGDMADVQAELNDIVTESGARLSSEDLDYILIETADELVDSRSNEVLRTALVIVNYLWAVLAALIPEIGGMQSSQPGGRIGTAMFLSWLVTTVLLSNTMSGFTSRRTCLRIMERYYRTLKGRKRDTHFFPNSPRLLARSSWVFSKKQQAAARLGASFRLDHDFIDAQPWNGSVYSYRYRKHLISSGAKEDWSSGYLLVLSVAPIAVAAASAFVIIWFTPTIGLGCRTLWVIGLTVGLMVSPFLTWSISRMAGGRFAWYITIAKDSAITVAVLTVIVLSSIGIFNNCWCWSGVYSRGRSQAFIDLDPAQERDYNLHHLYPAMVAACLGLQLVTYILMYRLMRVGGRVFRPDEDEKMDAYRRIHGLGPPSVSAAHHGQGVEMVTSPRLWGTPESRNDRQGSQGTDDGAALLLPEPAVSLQSTPHYSKYSSQVYTEYPMPGASSPSLSAAAASSSRRATRVNSEFEYGQSPEWRTSDQPLLGSPSMQGRV